jgi:hypothetical protein
VAILYGSSLDGRFHYDDFHSIVQNPHIRELGNSAAFFVNTDMFSVDEDKAMYRPLLLLSFALNYAFHGYDIVGYHVVNIALHYACVLLVWGIAIRMGCTQFVALIVAAMFCAHPLATEPVNYISSRSELMGACFFLRHFGRSWNPQGVSLGSPCCSLWADCCQSRLSSSCHWFSCSTIGGFEEKGQV